MEPIAKALQADQRRLVAAYFWQGDERRQLVACANCHGRDGGGLGDRIPPLVFNRFERARRTVTCWSWITPGNAMPMLPIHRCPPWTQTQGDGNGHCPLERAASAAALPCEWFANGKSTSGAIIMSKRFNPLAAAIATAVAGLVVAGCAMHGQSNPDSTNSTGTETSDSSSVGTSAPTDATRSTDAMNQTSQASSSGAMDSSVQSSATSQGVDTTSSSQVGQTDSSAMGSQSGTSTSSAGSTVDAQTQQPTSAYAGTGANSTANTNADGTLNGTASNTANSTAYGRAGDSSSSTAMSGSSAGSASNTSPSYGNDRPLAPRSDRN